LLVPAVAHRAVAGPDRVIRGDRQNQLADVVTPRFLGHYLVVLLVQDGVAFWAGWPPDALVAHDEDFVSGQ
jgi:hypothetical protein